MPTWYSSWSPEWLKPLFRHFTPDTISPEQLVDQLNAALKLPGVSNAWTMPIKARIDMLSTGMRTPVGLKIHGDDLGKIQEIGSQVEAVLRAGEGHAQRLRRADGGRLLPRLRLEPRSAGALRPDHRRRAGGGAERHRRREHHHHRRGPRALPGKRALHARFPVGPGRRSGACWCRPGTGRQIPLSDLAEIKPASGPGMIRDEGGMLTGYVYVDVAGRDPGSYVREAQDVVRQKVKLPPGFAITWSGQYEAMERVNKRLLLVLPVTAFLILLLLYLNTRSVVKTLIVVLAVPFSAIGAVWFLYLLGYNMSVGVWVGMIALLGVDAETGVFMLLYLDLAYAAGEEGGATEDAGRSARGDRARRGEAHPPEIHDRGDGLHRPGADPVGHGHRLGRDEANRRAADRRGVHVVPARVAGVSGDLRGVEVAF